MKYFIQNPQLEAIIKEIRKKIRLSMNGVVADKMKESGIRYKQNFISTTIFCSPSQISLATSFMRAAEPTEVPPNLSTFIFSDL